MAKLSQQSILNLQGKTSMNFNRMHKNLFNKKLNKLVNIKINSPKVNSMLGPKNKLKQDNKLYKQLVNLNDHNIFNIKLNLFI